MAKKQKQVWNLTAIDCEDYGFDDRIVNPLYRKPIKSSRRHRNPFKKRRIKDRFL